MKYLLRNLSSYFLKIFEKNTRHIKTYGIVVKYQSRTATHNMYKEYRDVSLNGAISQLCKPFTSKRVINYLDMEMSGRHRARHDTIQIVRTAVIKKSADIKRPYAQIYRVKCLNMFTHRCRTPRSSSPSPRSSLDLAKRNSEAPSRLTDPPPSRSKSEDHIIYILVRILFTSSCRDRNSLCVV